MAKSRRSVWYGSNIVAAWLAAYPEENGGISVMA
jgi:hypothetical protein